MYDTVRMWLITDGADNMLNMLENVGKNTKPNGEYYHYGNLRNMRVRASQNRVTIDGSLSKFVFGNNFERLGRIETSRAIENLSDTLGLPFYQARVSRIDIADNFTMKRPVREYLELLGNVPHLKRGSQENGSVRYSNGQRSIIFYDKTKEYQEKNCADLIPEAFTGKNVLRYELRYRKNLANQFKSEIKGKDLYNEDFYCSLIARWREVYLKIKKLNLMRSTEFKMQNIRDFKNYGFMITLLDEDNKKAVWGRLEHARKQGEMTDRTYYRCKNELNRLLENTRYFHPSDLIKELDEKIQQAANNNR